MSTATAVPRPNLVPGEYRGVAVADVDCALDEGSLRRFLTGRDAYRRTRFIVARNGSGTAVVSVRKKSVEPLFSPITDVTLLLGGDDSAYLRRPDVDTAVPTHLARVALDDAPHARGVVVEGRYGHVSFIIDPRPLHLTVREVVPPFPAKLADQVRRVLDVAEHLPPIELVPEVVDLAELALARPSAAYLLPCRGGGVTVGGASTSYLDQHPRHRDWLLIGCERSQQIHEWFYGERAEQVDICPRQRCPGRGAVLSKCCLLEHEIAVEDGQVVVPWGATLEQVGEALSLVAQLWEPAWAPA